MAGDPTAEAFDWSATTWEGSRREQYRRWASLDIAEMLNAQEQLAELARLLGHAPTSITHAEQR